MVRDEAPAATFRGSTKGMRPRGNRFGWVAGSIPGNGPVSLVAAEIHLGHKPAGIFDGWLHCNIQVACHPDSKSKYC
jgi:hypothetical protein